jgi:hypothetical protein
MTDPEEVADNSRERFMEIVERLWQIPRFVEAFDAPWNAPHMEVQCPEHHRLLTVKLSADHEGYPALETVSNEDRAVVSDGWAGLAGMEPNAPEGIDVRRLQFTCRECPYTGTWSLAKLLGLYAVNLQIRKRTITLSA